MYVYIYIYVCFVVRRNRGKKRKFFKLFEDGGSKRPSKTGKKAKRVLTPMVMTPWVAVHVHTPAIREALAGNIGSRC